MLMVLFFSDPHLKLSQLQTFSDIILSKCCGGIFWQICSKFLKTPYKLFLKLFIHTMYLITIYNYKSNLLQEQSKVL